MSTVHFHAEAHAALLRKEAIRIAKKVPAWRTTADHCRIVHGNFADVVSRDDLLAAADRRRDPKKISNL